MWETRGNHIRWRNLYRWVLLERRPVFSIIDASYAEQYILSFQCISCFNLYIIRYKMIKLPQGVPKSRDPSSRAPCAQRQMRSSTYSAFSVSVASTYILYVTKWSNYLKECQKVEIHRAEHHVRNDKKHLDDNFTYANKLPQDMASKNVSFNRHLLTGNCVFVDILCRESGFHRHVCWFDRLLAVFF